MRETTLIFLSVVDYKIMDVKTAEHHKKRVGSRAEVWHGTARQTSGGLRKADLMKNKSGRLVSRKKHAQGREAFSKNKLKPLTKEQLAQLKKNGPQESKIARRRRRREKREDRAGILKKTGVPG